MVSRLRTQSCSVVTRGRRTGAEHVVRVWFATIGECLYAASRNGLDGDWLQNALHEGELEVRAARHTWRGPASLVAPDDVGPVVEAFAVKYAKYPDIVAAWRAAPPTLVQAELRPAAGAGKTATL